MPKPMGHPAAAGIAALALITMMAAACGSGSGRPGNLDPSFGTGGVVATDYGLFADFWNVALQSDGRIVVGGHIKFDFALVRYAPDGKPDADFGSEGMVTTDIGGMDDVNAVAIQPDGGIVAVGQITVMANSPDGADFALARYTHDGKLDPSFGSGGIVTTDIGDNDDALAVALQPDGRIVAVGRIGSSRGDDLALVRYNPDGTLDPTFGSGGIVKTDIGSRDEATSVALQPDGRIVVAGTALARYTPDGRLDPSFGSGGIVKVQGFVYPRALAFQSDAKIVTGGPTGPTGGDFAVSRYTPDGELDPSFGIVKIPLVLSLHAVAFEPDGKVIIGGSTGESGSDFALTRYGPDGKLDASFGTGGTVSTDVGGSDSGMRAIALQPDGRIVVAGLGRPACRGFVGLCTSGPTELFVTRYFGN